MVCAAAEDDYECAALEEQGTSQYLLTCGSSEKCVHYAFFDESEQEATYNQCFGMPLRTKAHTCAAGHVGDSLCRRLVNGTSRDEFYYTRTEEYWRAQCEAKGGVWLGR
jgi:hypothetical protein